MTELQRFIRTYRKKGYSTAQLKSYLLSQGYSAEEIEKAFSELRRPNYIANYLAIAIAIIGVFIVAVLAVMYLVGPEEAAPTESGVEEIAEVPLSISAEAIDEEVIPGEPYRFISTFSRTGKARITYRVHKDSEIVFGQQKGVTLQGYLKDSINIPESLTSGKYQMTILVEQDGEYAQDRILLDVIEKAGRIAQKEEPRISREEPEKLIAPPAPSAPPAAIPAPSPIIPPKPIILSADAGLQEQAEAIVEIAKTNPSQAIDECAKISKPDYCYEKVAQALQDSSICDEIKASSARDRCIINNIMRTNDFLLCPSIEDPHLRDSCYALRNLKS